MSLAPSSFGPREGQVVSYIGDEADGLKIGDRGRVLSTAGSGCHVQWKTGGRSGSIDLVGNHEVVVQSSARSEVEDSFETAGIVSFAVRATYERSGDAGLINALYQEGHLSAFEAIAEEAMGLVAKRIREDPSMREVLSYLDEDEGSEFVSTATTLLLRDAFGSGR